MSNTSPRTIYLLSSGGYSNSRIVPEVSLFLGGNDLLTFFILSLSTDGASHSADTVSMKMEALSVELGTLAEKRTSIILVLLFPKSFEVESHLGKRSRPYDAVSTRDLPPCSRTPVFGQPPVPPSESATAAQTLNSIIPAIVQNPEAFQESIPTVCAEHNINPTILEALVQSLKTAQPVGNPSKDP